jgi:hypothetical protein
MSCNPMNRRFRLEKTKASSSAVHAETNQVVLAYWNDAEASASSDASASCYCRLSKDIGILVTALNRVVVKGRRGPAGCKGGAQPSPGRPTRSYNAARWVASHSR